MTTDKLPLAQAMRWKSKKVSATFQPLPVQDLASLLVFAILGVSI
jgi:hypothetical protein